MMKKHFSKTDALFKKASAFIPLASQTFSKSHLQYVRGAAPLFIERGKGAAVFDLDGNRYTDMIMGLLPAVLGYQDATVDRAIRHQLKKGITFSLPSPLEYELAKLLAEHIPSAEMVRFGKNGSDVTTGAIRVARAVTGRDHVAVCGYHGWHDWYIGSTTRDLGVPTSTKAMTHAFLYNDLCSLEKIFEEQRGAVAAVIMEPESYEAPEKGFLKEVKELVHTHGALLIFDEVITGFRWSMGGAQQYYGVIPDLACVGKSMANGMPISALVGRRAYMKKVEDIFYSFTFGGETLSIAAAIATINKLKEKKVIAYIWRIGEMLQKGTNALIKKHGLDSIIALKGKPCWQVWNIKPSHGFSDLEIKSFIQQEVIAEGFLWYGQHNMSFAHTTGMMRELLRVYDEVLEHLAEKIAHGTLRNALLGRPIQQVFKVR